MAQAFRFTVSKCRAAEDVSLHLNPDKKNSVVLLLTIAIPQNSAFVQQ